jgi:amidophosphoribosyltransferase
VGGFFGVVSDVDCVADLYYGTDYHSHLGTMRGGLAVRNSQGFTRFIHDITNSQFRSKFEDELPKLHGSTGIGVISDYDDQPLLVASHHGRYAIVTVGKLDNLDDLVSSILSKSGTHLLEMSGDEPNPTEVVANLIDQGDTLVEGIRHAQEKIEGSCSILLLTEDGVYAARDRLGRTPIAIGEKPGAYAATLETCALPNCADNCRRRRAGRPAWGPHADLRFPLGLLRISRIELRGHQRRGRALPLRPLPGQAR